MPLLSGATAILLFLGAQPGLAAAPVAAEPEAASEAKEAKPPETAAAIVERCGSPDLTAERECYAAGLNARLADGPAPALELLGALAALDVDVRRDGHMYAHRIGIEALKSTDEVSNVFASCTPAWQSGCYHGVIQSYFLATERAGGGVTAESVDALCADYRGKRADLLFQCTHGLGHGLTMLYRHDLPRALRSCDLLARADEREMCHAGAFMENIVNATHPHTPGATHAPEQAAAGHEAHGAEGGHQGHGGHEGHGAAAAAAKPAAAAGAAKPDAAAKPAAAAPEPPFRALDPDDLHYPCSLMGEKYLIGCYTIQTSAMLHHSKQDVGRVATECGRAPENARATCFLSLGRDVSTIALGNSAEAVRLCGLVEAGFRPVCHRGVVESIVNMNADPAEGIPYCKAVPEADGKRACYVAVGLQALVLPDGEARRETACRTAEPAMAAACSGKPEAPPAREEAAPASTAGAD